MAAPATACFASLIPVGSGKLDGLVPGFKNVSKGSGDCGRWIAKYAS